MNGVHRILVLLGLLVLTGCNPPDESKPAADQTLDVDATTYVPNGTVDGCRLYYVRPRHGSSFHLAVCSRQSTTTWRKNCGKGCSWDISINTQHGEL